MSTGSSDTDRLFDEIKQVAKPSIAKRAGDQTPGDSLETSSNHRVRVPRSPTNMPQISGYEILEEIHRGGQGVVFKALQKSTHRIVALKFILQGSFATERQRFRFEREVDLAARLNHPNIVTIYDSGIVDGQPYCAMEFVDGEPLSHRSVFEHPHSAQNRQIAKLFLEISEAVGYAHQRGVVHRDLKPGNILIDREGNAHVLDFGLAKVLGDEHSAEHSPHTMTGEFVGTLAYASPEQAQTNPSLIDTRSDVYSLGVVFYELLTGKMPYDVLGSIADTLSHIIETDPTRPRLIAAGVDADLETILLKSLSKDPQRRYQNAVELSADFKRYLNHEPIDARRDSTWYVFKKTLRRHRIFASAVLSIFVVLLVAVVAISIFYLQAALDRDIAQESQTKEEQQRKTAEEKTKLAETERDNSEFASYKSRLAAAEASVRVYDSFDALENLSAAPKKLRNLEWNWLLNRVDLGSTTSQDLKAYLPVVEYTHDGRHLISVANDGNLYVFEAESLQLIDQVNVGKSLTSLALHPDGTTAFVGREDGKLNVVDLVNRTVLRELKTGSSRINKVVYIPELAQLAASCGWDTNDPGVTCIWNTDNFELVRRLEGHQEPHMSLAYDPVNQVLATAADDVYLWNLQNGEKLATLESHGDWVFSMTFSPDGKYLVTGAGDGLIRVFATKSRRLRRRIYGHSSYVRSLQYSKDGRELLSAGEDRTIRTWNAWTWIPQQVYWGSLTGVTCARYRADEKQIASVNNGRVKLWDINTDFQKSLNQADYSAINVLAFGDDENTLITGGQSGHVKQWRFGKLPSVETLHVCESSVTALDYSAITDQAVWGTQNGEVWVRDLSSGNQTVFRIPAGRTMGCKVFDKGNRAVVVHQNKTISWLGLGQHPKVLHSKTCADAIRGVALAEDLQFLLTVHEDYVALRNLTDGSLTRKIERQAGFYETKRTPIALSSQLGLVVVPHRANALGIFDIKTGKLIRMLRGHLDTIQCLQFSADGSRLITGSRDGKIKFWDTQRWENLLTIRELVGYADEIAIGPNSNAIAAGMFNGQLRYWKTSGPRPRE